MELGTSRSGAPGKGRRRARLGEDADRSLYPHPQNRRRIGAAGLPVPASDFLSAFGGNWMLGRSAVRLIALRVGVACVSFTCGLFAIEVLLRFHAARENREALEHALREIVPPVEHAAAGLANIIRLHPDDRIAYELQPNLVQRTYRGARIDTNSRGFRGPEIEPARANTVTIVGLGDSIQFGHGVEESRTYLRVMEGVLAKRFPEVHWRVVNTAVPGYNTVMEVATLREKALDLEPDLVIVNICPNDFAPPRFVRRVEDVWTVRRSYLLDFVREHWSSSREAEVVTASHGGSPILQSGGDGWVERESDGVRRVPERYRQLLGVEGYRAALDELSELASAHDFQVLFFTNYDWGNTHVMMAEAAQRGFECVSLMDELEAWFLRHQGQPFSEERYRRSPLVVSQQNFHPSALQHGMAARRLLRELNQRGILPRLLSRVSPERIALDD